MSGLLRLGADPGNIPAEPDKPRRHPGGTSKEVYYKLLKNVQNGSIMLEEFARSQIAAEEMHEAELRKMLLDNF